MITLARAFLCLDEEIIVDGATGRCPSCGSEAIESVARWLNRDERPVKITVGPLALLAIAEESGLDVTPEAWA